LPFVFLPFVVALLEVNDSSNSTDSLEDSEYNYYKYNKKYCKEALVNMLDFTGFILQIL